MDITIQKVILPVFVSVGVAAATFIARGAAFGLLRKWDQRVVTRMLAAEKKNRFWWNRKRRLWNRSLAVSL